MPCLRCKYKIKLTPFALWNTIVVLLIALIFYLGMMWVVCNVSLNGYLVSETYFNHKKPMIIISESMEPTIMTNSLLIVCDTAYEDIKVGDIILIDTAKHGLVIHRAVEKCEEGFITKGDNNLLQDDWVVTKEMYKGRVDKIHNEVAGVVTFLFGDFTQIQTIRLLIGFFILALIITAVVVIVNWLYDYIFVAYFLKRGKRKGNIKSLYFDWLDLQTNDEDVELVVSELDAKRTIIQELVFRYRLMRWYNAVKEEQKHLIKVNKRYMNLKGACKR